MWSESRFETRMQQALTRALDSAKAEEVFSAYISARTVLLEDILNEIRGAEPHLTDHGVDHVHNVLDNVDRLLPPKEDHFTARELYLLGLCVLFHDVGNLEGRVDHQKRISKFYDHARPGAPQRWAHEKRLVVAATKAHAGRALDETYDTLKPISNAEILDGDPIHLQEIAALVRFADELAEGRQRTSLFLLAKKKYPPGSLVHHQYAAVTRVAIDRGNGRIALTYDLVLENCGSTMEQRLVQLTDLLRYIYDRIAKLDEERKYARFYCSDVLAPFRLTSVQINIQANGDFVDLGLEPIGLTDKVVPGDGPSMTLPDINPAYRPETIAERMRQQLPNEPPAASTPQAGQKGKMR